MYQAKVLLCLVTTLQPRVRHIAFPSTAYCDIPSPDMAYCITGYGIFLSAYGILHHRIRHIALGYGILYLCIWHIASPDTAYCSRTRHIVSLHTAYCISAYGILHIRIQHYGMLILSTIPLHTHSLTHSPTYPLTHSPAHPLAPSPAHPFTRSPAHPLTCSTAHPLTRSLTPLRRVTQTNTIPEVVVIRVTPDNKVGKVTRVTPDHKVHKDRQAHGDRQV